MKNVATVLFCAPPFAHAGTLIKTLTLELLANAFYDTRDANYFLLRLR
jgi:hypothetical protein